MVLRYYTVVIIMVVEALSGNGYVYFSPGKGFEHYFNATSNFLTGNGRYHSMGKTLLAHIRLNCWQNTNNGW